MHTSILVDDFWIISDFYRYLNTALCRHFCSKTVAFKNNNVEDSLILVALHVVVYFSVLVTNNVLIDG